MKKGFTLIELLAVIIIMLVIIWFFILIKHKNNTNCYWTSEGIICNFGKIGGLK